MFHDFHRSFCFHNMDAAQTPGLNLFIDNLEFKTHVTVFVSAQNADNERGSSNCSVSFTTPSCAHMLDDASMSAFCGEMIVSLVFQSVGCSR